MEEEMRSVELGDMKSLMVEEMSILWSAIRSSDRNTDQWGQTTDHSDVCLLFVHVKDSPQMFITASVLKSSPSIHTGDHNYTHKQKTLH